MSTGSHRICEICGMRERHCNKPLYYATFPSDPNRCRLWLKAVGKEDLVYLPIEKLSHMRHVCGDHFHKKEFGKKGSLKKTAIPSLNLRAPALSDDLFAGFPLHIAMRQNVPHSTCVPTQMQVDSNLPSTSHQNETVPHSTCVPTQMQVDSNLPSTSHQNETVPHSTCVPTQMQVDSNLPSTSHQNETVPHSTCVPTQMRVDSNLPSTSHQNETESNPITIDDSTQTIKSSIRGLKRKFEEKENSDPSDKIIRLARETVSKGSVKSAKKCVRLIDSIQSPVLREIVVNACRNQERKATGRRWTNLHKAAMLGIYKRSPKTYRHIAEIMPLPSEKTLQTILKKVPMSPGLNEAALNHLNEKAEETDTKNKQCTLLFDEMSLKRRIIYNESLDLVEGFEDYGQGERTTELADHALVLMLQGLCAKFKQPIGMFFVKGTISSLKLAQILKTIIERVADTGYNIVSTVCDQGPTNMGALKVLRDRSGPQQSDHYFTVNGKKVFSVYDVPHLFKSIRNNFHKNGTIILDNKKGQWRHIQQVEEKNRNFLYLSKITPIHIDPKYRAKMKVKYAAQVLSNTVSAVMKLMSECNQNKEEAEEMLKTAVIIQDLDRLFDITNGPASPDDTKTGQRENVSQKTNHMVNWVMWIKKLATLKFLKNGNEAKNVKCIEGYIKTLKSFRDIWLYLQTLGFKYLNLRQLNQDALENLFGVIRQHGATNRNPTCSHFMSAIKTTIITRMTAHHSRGSNCQKDGNLLLTDFQGTVFGTNKPTKATVEMADTEKESDSPTANTSDCVPQLSLPEEPQDELVVEDLADVSEQAAVYVSGYIASRILKNVDCETCRKILSVGNPGPSPIYRYIKLREWWKNKLSLTYPTIPLCNTIQTAVITFERQICPILHMPFISQLTVTILMTKCDFQWFNCPLHAKNINNLLFTPLAKLFIRRQCQRINRDIALQEERIADSNKKAQQMGVAK